MINIDFYRELSLLYKDNNRQRIERFKNLNDKICEIYNIKDKGIFSIKSIKDEKGNQTDIGSFDAFSREMILESTYVKEEKLSQTQLFETMESLLHEPKHLKQLLEYEKDNSSYPGFYTSLPTHLGYHSQKEEDEAYIQTYLEMQEIIDSHKNTTGNEKLFYDNMQKYVNSRIKEHTKFKEEDVKNFENLDIKLGNFFTTKNKKQENFLDILKTIKEDFQPNAYVSASYEKLLPTCTGYEKIDFKENTCEIFEHDKTWYGKIESKNQIDKHSMVFEIKNDKLNISSFTGIINLEVFKYNFQMCSEIYRNVLEIKDFYKKENSINIKINFAKYQIDNGNEEYKKLMDYLNSKNLEINDIGSEFEFARIKTSLKDFLLFNKKNFEGIINELSNSNILDTDTKDVLRQIDINDKNTENAFKDYLIRTFSKSDKNSNVIDSMLLKNFQGNLDSRYLLKQIDKIKNNDKDDIEKDIEKFKIENKNVENYITKRNESER